VKPAHFIRSAATTTALCAVLVSPAVADAQHRFALEGWYWQGDLSASARVSDGTLGTVLDFKDDLAVADEDIPEGRLVVTLGPHSRLRFGHLSVGYSGDAIVARTLEFAGETYTVGTRVLTNLDKRYTRLGWIWQFARSADGVLRFGTVLEAKALSIDADLAAPDLAEPINESESFDGVLPTVGIALDIVPHRAVEVFVEGSGLDAGSRGSMVDAEAGIRIFPIPGLGLLASYRVLDLRLEDDPDYAKLRIKGPFLGVSLRF